MNNNFDVLAYLNDHPDIEWNKFGKNIGKLVGLKSCFWCQDDAYHLGISISPTQFLSCWKCGYHSITDFLVKTEGSYFKAKEALGKYKLNPTDILEELQELENKEDHQNTKLILPKPFTSVLPQIAKDYLKKRRYSYLDLQKKYDVMFSGNFGRASWRVVFPVYMENKLVNWIGRDVSENPRALPYIFALDSEAVVKRAGLIFNLDSVKENGSAIITEGVMDACRVDGIALLSVNFTKQQLVKLKQKKLKTAYLAMDNDEPGRRAQKKLESAMSSFVDNIYNIEYNMHDLDSLGEDEVRELKRMIV